MAFGVDILEDDIKNMGEGILETLLMDRTTGRNIIWATKDYETRGDLYAFDRCIEVNAITGVNNHIIRPRIDKKADNQRSRSRDMAEVFTPSWICNAQNNLIDNAWFGAEEVFNHEVNDGELHSWVSFDTPRIPEGKDWRKYVRDIRLEMACGEAPYLVSRYDATTGEPIEIGSRIGMLDRKLWLINKNTPDILDGMTRAERKNVHKTWRRAVYKAYKSIYGFEWQGDNLLLAREALFITFIEYYQAKWQTEKLPEKTFMQNIAEIISWNLWQMDGLKHGIPGKDPTEILPEPGVLEFSQPDLPADLRYCRIMEWQHTDRLTGTPTIFKLLLNDKI